MDGFFDNEINGVNIESALYFDCKEDQYMSDKFIYDEVPYPSFTFPQTHPDRLATIGRLHGMKPERPENCRYLELGCGDGTNLISFAYALPSSNFVGIDLSAHHIDGANRTIERLGLTNIVFRQADVTEVSGNKVGKFDFIVAHGLYSWVPDFVREAILTVFSESLVENGVGYISYNAYPGCHLRKITFSALQYSAADVNDPMDRVERGIENLRSFAEAAEEGSLVRSILALEYDQMLERTPENVFHDEFAEINQPFYFHEFAAKINEYGFKFLSEADPTANTDAKLSDAGRKLLDSVNHDRIRREQYYDFIRFTRFRRTLFCRNKIQLSQDIDPLVVRGLFISSQIEAEQENANFTDDSPVKFSDSKEASVVVNHPLTKTVLRHLRSRGASSVTFDELMEEAAKILEQESIDGEDSDRTVNFLIHLFNAGMVKFLTHQVPFSNIATQRPEVSAFARWQIENGSQSVATMTGNNLEVKNMMLRAMIVMLDGTRSRQDLENDLKDLLDVPNDQRMEFESQLSQMVDSNLQHMADSGLLVR